MLNIKESPLIILKLIELAIKYHPQFPCRNPLVESAGYSNIKSICERNLVFFVDVINWNVGFSALRNAHFVIKSWNY